jgi:hypothetical protein
MHFVPTTQQIVDIFTKDFLGVDLSFVSKLGMINIYAPT